MSNFHEDDPQAGQKLGQAIFDAAAEAHIVDPSAVIDGPQAMMLLEDLKLAYLNVMKLWNREPTEEHRLLGFVLEMREIGSYPVWVCGSETFNKAVADKLLEVVRHEAMIPRLGMSKVIYKLTEAGNRRFMYLHYAKESYKQDFKLADASGEQVKLK